MVFVSAHAVDTRQLNELLRTEREQLDQIQRFLDTELQTTHLDSSASSVRRSVDILSRVKPDSPELVTWCTFIAEARAALFTFARRQERTRWQLLGTERTLVGSPPAESLQAGSWRTGFWFAWATRDAHALALLSQVPAKLIVEWESFDRPMVQALQGVVTGSPQTGAWITQALELADPEKVRRTNPDWVLNILVPIFECLMPIIDHDEKRFETTLVKLLNLRRDHFAKGLAKGSDSVQRLSEEGVGLVAWAKTLGFTVPVESPYLPPALVNLSPPTVTACSECLTPTSEGAAECQACGRKMSDDELHFGFDEWLSLDRDECRSCGHRYPLAGQKCPVCLTTRV